VRKGIFPAIFIAILLLAIVAPTFINSFQLSLLTEILIWGLLAMAFDLLYGYTGMLSLGQSVYFGLGAYGAALAILHLDAGLWTAMLLSVALATVAAWIIGIWAIRVRGHGFIIVTVVMSIVFYLLALSWSWFTGGDDGLAFAVPPLKFGEWKVSLIQLHVSYYFVLFFAAASSAILWWLMATPLGLAFKLIRENEERAAQIGYNVKRLKLISFILAGSFSGLAGTLYAIAHRFVWAGLMHWIVSADAVVWTLFGGAGTLVGPILGTALLRIAQQYLSSWWSYGHPLLVGTLIILVVTFAPKGIVGTIKERIRKIR